MYLILLCFGTLFGLGAFFLLAGLLRLPTSASTKAVLTVTSRGKSQKGSINAVLFDMAARLSPLVHLDNYKRKKLEAQLKSAEIKMSPETYIAAAWVKAGLIALLIIPALLIFPILAPVIVFLAVAVYFKEQKRADEIVQQRREEIEAELPRFVNTIEQELRASRDVLNTVSLSSAQYPFQLLAVSRPVDISPLLSELSATLTSSSDVKQKELLKQEIVEMGAFALSGEVVERQFYIKIWDRVSDGVERDLLQKLKLLGGYFSDSGIQTEILQQQDIVRLCNLVNNPAYVHLEDSGINAAIPILESVGVA